LYQRSLRQFVRRTLDEYVDAVEDYLPEEMRGSLSLVGLTDAIKHYHFPVDEEDKRRSEQRLAFDELLLVQLGLLLRKHRWQHPAPDVAIAVDKALLEAYCRSLPFELTRAQRQAVDEILHDLSHTVPMSRLLQGDVGSGKTVVAGAALLQVVTDCKQGALMAPTEILAEQHYVTLSQFLAPFGIRCELLIGSTPKAQRRAILAALQDGSAHVIVGTHALIQQDVNFAALGLCVADEQHRFGVEQRGVLRSKGLHPHVLAMTATPIPRTLSMTIYGDLDISVIDELPPGRTPAITTWSRTPAEAYGVVRDEVRQGHQAFIICPVIEESSEPASRSAYDSDMRSVLAEHRELQLLTFRDMNVGLLHGRMKPKEKEATLAAFRQGEIQILVATSVVEVGIDIPNATVMVIRDAHRFGLAQLHQFRGRVGRGGAQAYCVLLSPSEGDDARERLEALTATDDGFELAEQDLRLRGPGEFWGTRQSGLPELRVAQLGDVPTIQLARKAAVAILAADPELDTARNRLLREQVQRFWADAADLS
jgi:ATP-dependent DNA helicase RecG